MNRQPLPLIDIPLDLSDEAAAKLIDFLLQLAHQLENHYSEQPTDTTMESMNDNSTSGPAPNRPPESSSGAPAPQDTHAAVRQISAVLHSR